MWFLRNKAPNNAALLPIAFLSISKINTETHHSNKEKKAVGILHSPRKVSPLLPLLHDQVKADNKPLVTILKKDGASL